MGPLIGITSQRREVETSTGRQSAQSVTESYSRAVLGAGGVPIMLPIGPPEAAPVIVSRLDGVVLTGGGDVQPSIYNGGRETAIYGVDVERDHFEIALVKEIARTRLPTLAICRGLQVLNVALGGTLVVDIPTEVPGAFEHFVSGDAAMEAHQPVELTEGGRLAGLLGVTELKVNSIHHQSVLDPAPGLRPTAWSPDGVIEALDAENDDWPLLAVQWHPEFLVDGHQHARELFRALVESATRAADGRN